MQNQSTIILSGIVFGLSAGLSPGPLLTLLVSQTLQHGLKEGMKIAVVPLITDLPIILLTSGILSSLFNIQSLFGIISILGGLFLFYLGYESITFQGMDMNPNQKKPQSFRKGILVNFLNPNPYLFWLSIGTPTILKAVHINLWTPVLFILSFYIFLIGIKFTIVVLIEKSRHVLKSSYYIFMNKMLGIILWIFALIFMKEGLNKLGFL